MAAVGALRASQCVPVLGPPGGDVACNRPGSYGCLAGRAAVKVRWPRVTADSTHPTHERCSSLFLELRLGMQKSDARVDRRFVTAAVGFEDQAPYIFDRR